MSLQVFSNLCQRIRGRPPHLLIWVCEARPHFREHFARRRCAHESEPIKCRGADLPIAGVEHGLGIDVGEHLNRLHAHGVIGIRKAVSEAWYEGAQNGCRSEVAQVVNCVHLKAGVCGCEHVGENRKADAGLQAEVAESVNCLPSHFLILILGEPCQKGYGGGCVLTPVSKSREHVDSEHLVWMVRVSGDCYQGVKAFGPDDRQACHAAKGELSIVGFRKAEEFWFSRFPFGTKQGQAQHSAASHLYFGIIGEFPGDGLGEFATGKANQNCTCGAFGPWLCVLEPFHQAGQCIGPNVMHSLSGFLLLRGWNPALPFDWDGQKAIPDIWAAPVFREPIEEGTPCVPGLPIKCEECRQREGGDEKGHHQKSSSTAHVKSVS